MISTRFTLIFWGLLLVILDLTINSFDLLPDFLGYILVAIGCSGLASISRRFATASALSWILMVFAIVGYALHDSATTAFGILSLAVDCSMMWFLLGGVMELAAARQRMDLSERASRRRIAYVALVCLATLAGWTGEGSPETAIAMAVVVILCMLPLLFLILHLIHRAKHELASDHDS